MPTVNSAYTRDGLNRYTAVAGAGYSYDANGNLTGNGSKTFGYDVENRLTSVTGGAGLALTYDPLGRLRQTTSGATVVQFLYDGDRLVAEYNGGGTVLRRYAHGPGIDEPLVWYEGSGLATRNFLHADERGTVIATSDNSGAGTVYSYGPYGEPNVWTGPRFKYTGQIALPEAALYHYKARVYDPAIGRFLQTDPVGYEDDPNLYAYTYNEPIALTDPPGAGGKVILLHPDSAKAENRTKETNLLNTARQANPTHINIVAAHGSRLGLYDTRAGEFLTLNSAVEAITHAEGYDPNQAVISSACNLAEWSEVDDLARRLGQSVYAGKGFVWQGSDGRGGVRYSVSSSNEVNKKDRTYVEYSASGVPTGREFSEVTISDDGTITMRGTEPVSGSRIDKKVTVKCVDKICKG